MAKLESTAVNALIVGLIPLRRDSDVELFRRPVAKPVPRPVDARAVEIPSLPRLRPAAGTTPPRLAEIFTPVQTMRVAKRAPHGRSYLWYAVPLVIVASVGASYLLRSHDQEPVPIAVAPDAVAPTPPPIAKPRMPVTPALVDVRFDSEPEGATVAIVTADGATIVGTTPVIGGVDPSRLVEVVFTVADREPRTERFDPGLTRKVATTFRPVPVAATVEAPPRQPQRVARSVHKHRAATVAQAGTGTLMISSKPPCRIIIDGAPTGLVTPQRAIALAAGRHSVTFVNDAAKLEKTVTVDIAASRSTKLIRDLMAK